MLDMDFTSPVFLVGMLISTFGLGLFMYGKRTTRPPQLVAGIVLMVVPYFASTMIVLSGVTAVVMGGLWAVTSGKF